MKHPLLIPRNGFSVGLGERSLCRWRVRRWRWRGAGAFRPRLRRWLRWQWRGGHAFLHHGRSERSELRHHENRPLSSVTTKITVGTSVTTKASPLKPVTTKIAV